MTRLSILFRAFLPLVVLFLNCQEGFSQVSRPFRYNNDIGIDFAPFLRGESGISLLYKHSLGKTTDLERRKRYALRLLLGYYEDPNNGSSYFRPQVADTTFYFEHTGRSKHQFLRLGTELQINKKNFRFNIGADLGYRYWTSMLDHQTIAEVNGVRFATDQHQSTYKANVVEASILAGVSYFFLPRFSVGLEANCSAGLEFSKSNTIRNGVTTFSNSNTIFEVDVRLFRLLFLNYHFGKPTPKDL